MPRQGPLLLMIICLGLSSQSLAQEYPFIHYTPKDGLINSRIRNVYQDSKGRMFFLTANGLSIYDGVRFNNYSTEDGLANPVVNDMLEISPDSLLLATNTSALNIWVRGKVKNFPIPGPCPVINKFIRATDGRIYVATDNGVYQFDEGRFIKMDADNSVKKRRSSFDDIQEIGHYFLLRVNFDMTHTTGLYLLDRITKKLIPFANEAFNSVTQIPEDNLLLCTNPDRVIAFNLTAAASGIAQPMALPAIYQPLTKIKMDAVFIDKKGSIWCVRRNSIVKIPRSGNVLTYDKTTGLDVNNINNVFIDRENILWIQTDGSGLIKLANNNVEIVTGLFSKSATGISAIHANPKSDATWLFDSEDYTLYCCPPREIFRNSITPRIKASQILQEGSSLYIMDGRTIYSAALHPKIHSVSLKLYYQFEKGGAANTNRTIAYGKYLFVPGSGITVVTSGKPIFRV